MFSKQELELIVALCIMDDEVARFVRSVVQGNLAGRRDAVDLLRLKAMGILRKQAEEQELLTKKDKKK